ncbi:hypothetical protein V2I01_17890 [Micromonospora sp. BRA006-A]|nr:hypothetical protein [Micromonospora sp. BRA006-A]
MQVTFDDRTNDAVAGVVSTDYTYDPFGRISQVSQTQPDGGTKPRRRRSRPATASTRTGGSPACGTRSWPGRLKVSRSTTSTAPPRAATAGWPPFGSGPNCSGPPRAPTARTGSPPRNPATASPPPRRSTGPVDSSPPRRRQPSDVNPNATLFSEGYTYDDEGNLKSRSQQAVAEKFTYDALDHLSTATTSNTTTGAVYQTDSWTYDKLGNLTTSELRGDYTYGDPKKPTQVTKVTGGLFGTRAYGYDAVGNQTARPDGTIAYNDIDLPAPRAARPRHALRRQRRPHPTEAAGNGRATSRPGLYERQRYEHRAPAARVRRSHRGHPHLHRQAADVVATRQETSCAPTAWGCRD